MFLSKRGARDLTEMNGEVYRLSHWQVLDTKVDAGDIRRKGAMHQSLFALRCDCLCLWLMQCVEKHRLQFFLVRICQDMCWMIEISVVKEQSVSCVEHMLSVQTAIFS